MPASRNRQLPTRFRPSPVPQTLPPKAARKKRHSGPAHQFTGPAEHDAHALTAELQAILMEPVGGEGNQSPEHEVDSSSRTATQHSRAAGTNKILTTFTSSCSSASAGIRDLSFR